jgi:hypothetical protein
MFFWMQQAHQLSQQSLHSTQRNFIAAIGMHYRNQLNIRGNKHISIPALNRCYRNAQSVVAIATRKGNHHFHRGINTNLLQQLFQQTQPTFLVAITPRYRNALIHWLLYNQLLQPNTWCCQKIWCSKGRFLVVPGPSRPRRRLTNSRRRSPTRRSSLCPRMASLCTFTLPQPPRWSARSSW